jgi:hypothetical protein
MGSDARISGGGDDERCRIVLYGTVLERQSPRLDCRAVRPMPSQDAFRNNYPASDTLDERVGHLFVVHGRLVRLYRWERRDLDWRSADPYHSATVQTKFPGDSRLGPSVVVIGSDRLCQRTVHPIGGKSFRYSVIASPAHREVLPTEGTVGSVTNLRAVSEYLGSHSVLSSGAGVGTGTALVARSGVAIASSK